MQPEAGFGSAGPKRIAPNCVAQAFAMAVGLLQKNHDIPSESYGWSRTQLNGSKHDKVKNRGSDAQEST